MIKQLLFLLLIITSAAHSSAPQEKNLDHADIKGFTESFISSYELSLEGRYTHEYHPFLLAYTSQSLDQLEQYMSTAGLNLDGRLVIMGYEEQAVPQYQTNFSQERINDEAMRKNSSGWSQKLHNRFGFMTGFLFKQLQKIHLLYPKLLDQSFQHIDAHLIEIFDDKASILQEHALGEALPFMLDAEEYMLQLLSKKDPKKVFALLERFWHIMHRHAFRVGNQEIAGTPDVLFSIEYIRHLQRSKLPLNRFFIGPDLTYPIEITLKQGAGATVHAQNFAKEFTKHLVPAHDEPTVYVFCSFVDGVGKSTMLGNIKNWMRHGEDLKSFDHVDNSSSQLAEIFQYTDNVFIADLPAQVSHFTYKPDGKVFVDAATEYDEAELAKRREYALKQRTHLVNSYEEALDLTEQAITAKGYFIPELNNPDTPHAIFLKNVILLGKRSSNRWIPFEYNGEPYLFKDAKPYEIRCLVSLGNVRSEGLKNIETEQMLFTKGIKFPYKFEYFLHDLTTRLQEHGVKHVRFVDFLSMYPRSSRENIRINYLLQQMAHLFPGFTPDESLYKDFVSGGELLYTFMSPTKREVIARGFSHEALTRYALFHSLWTVANSSVQELSIAQLTPILQQEIAQFANSKKHINACVEKKIAHEAIQLDHIYGMSKSFMNVQLQSLPNIVRFSQCLSNFFTHNVHHEQLAKLWEQLEAPALPTKHLVDGERISDRNEKPTAQINSSTAVRPLFILHEDCKNQELLAPAIRMLRSCWYSNIINLLYADDITTDDHINMTKPWLRGIPIQAVPFNQALQTTTAAQQSRSKFIAIVQPWTAACPAESVKQSLRSSFRCFALQSHKAEAHTIIDGMLYRRDWASATTNHGLLNFDCCVQEDVEQKENSLSIVTSVIQKHQNKTSSTRVLPTCDLWELTQQDQWWRSDMNIIKQQAYRNGSFDMLLEKRRKNPTQESWQRPMYVLPENRKPLAQLVVRLLATLEMIIKDPDSNIVLRMNNHDDFTAAIKLIEYIILPTYCNTYAAKALFDDYDQVEPYPSWSHWH